MLSLSLKKLLSRTTLDNITVQAVTEDAEVSRKTFYYHFHDVYDLLKWTLTEETRRFMETEFEPSSIDQGLDAFVDFLIQNRAMVLNVYHSLDRSVIEQEIITVSRPKLQKYFSDSRYFTELSESDQRFIVDMVAYGLSGMTLHWIGEGMMERPEEFMSKIHRFFSVSLEASLHDWTDSSGQTETK